MRCAALTREKTSSPGEPETLPALPPNARLYIRAVAAEPLLPVEKHKEVLGYAQIDIADREVASTRSGR